MIVCAKHVECGLESGHGGKCCAVITCDELDAFKGQSLRLDHALKDVEAWRFAAGVNNTAREETDAENQQLRSRLDTARRAFDAWEASNERGESGPIDEELYVGLEALRVVETSVSKTVAACGDRYVDGMTRVFECNRPHGHAEWHSDGSASWPHAPNAARV